MSDKRNFLLFILLGLLLSLMFSSGQIENPDTHLRLTQSRILLETGKVGFPDDVGEDFHGNIAINQHNQRHMVYNPGQSFIFLPIYYLVSEIFDSEAKIYYTSAFIVSFTNYLIHTISAFFLFKIAISSGTTRRKALIVALIFCLTSYSFSFAQSTYEHHYEMLFILIGFYLVCLRENYKYALLAGSVLAMGMVFRSTTILAVPGILLLLQNNKHRLWFIVGIIPGIVFVLAYNFYRFENPFESGYNLAWQLAHGDTKEFWSVARMPLAMVGFLFSPGKGLLFFSPTVLLALLGIKGFYNEHRKLLISLLITASLYIGLYSMNFAWHGSIWSFGPRYILPIVPLLYLPLIKVKLKKWMYLFLVAGFLGQIILISVNYKREILEQYTKFNGLDETEYIFTFNNNPYTVQLIQLIKIIPKNIAGDLSNYSPDTAWRKEVRTASNEDVLKTSIEKNSINFWWVRMFHWETSTFQKATTYFIVLGSIISLILISKYVKRIK